MGRRRVALLVVVATCTGVTAAPAEAAFPGENGKILFVTLGPPQDESISTIDPDGTNVTRVTNFAFDEARGLRRGPGSRSSAEG
jgi:hypothetical protein